MTQCVGGNDCRWIWDTFGGRRTNLDDERLRFSGHWGRPPNDDAQLLTNAPISLILVELSRVNRGPTY